VSASRQLGVNNLPRVVMQPRPARDRTRDLLIAIPTPYHCATTPPHVTCVIRKFRYIYKGTSLWNFDPNSGLRKNSPQHIDRRTCDQLSSRKLDAQSVINWTIVGQLQYFRAPTLDHCGLAQRSPSSVYSTILSRGSVSDS